MRKTYLLLIINIKFVVGFGQCTFPVIHLDGSSTVNGININVIPEGAAQEYPIWLNYCNGTYGYKYRIGNDTLGGSYTFEFTPSISALTLNVMGVTNTGNHVEEVRIFINDNHYPLNTLGFNNGCDQLAQLTVAGDIKGCNSCSTSNTNGITIEGVIYRLKMQDVVISGGPNASAFALFICDAVLSTSDYSRQLRIAPNPFLSATKLITDKTLENATLEIYNSMGQMVNKIEHINGDSITIHRENLSAGVYSIKLSEKNKIQIVSKIIITDF